MKILIEPTSDQWSKLTRRPFSNDTELREKVAEIMKSIRLQGEKALRRYAFQFDGLHEDQALRVSDQERENLQLDMGLKKAIDQAYDNIRHFHSSQFISETKIETAPGLHCWREGRPIDKVGLYIPGGTAPLISTVLMLGVPAQLAACQQVVLLSPPNEMGNIDPAIIYAAQRCGITEIFKLGGAQAIAALCFGAADIPAVDKIFGPGNRYVTEAKRQAQLAGVAIDMPAGPSEVLVLADTDSNPEWLAADLLSQAEHGPDSQVILLAPHKELVVQVEKAIEAQLASLPRRAIAEKALDHSYALVLAEKAQRFEFCNQYAPEHLILAYAEAAQDIALIRNAGSVFVGPYSSESLGDYASGTNHTLPTAGFARAYSGVSLASFQKHITFQEAQREGLAHLADTVVNLARAEGLEAHAQSVIKRLENEK